MLCNPTYNKMNHENEIDQIWGFGGKDDDDDDDIDSSSDDSESKSHGQEPVLKKHKLIKDFILPENDDVDFSRRSHNEDLLDQGTIVCIKDKKTNSGKKRGLIKTKKTVKGPRGLLKKEAGKKKSKLTSQVSVSDDLRIFTETVIAELRVARENMFAQMREDMRKLITSSGATTKPKRKRGVRKTSQKQQKKSTAVNDKSTEAKKCKKVLEEKDHNHDQTNETITSEEKEKDLEKSSVKNPIHVSQQDQVISTSYLTGNDSSLKLERGNLLTDANGQPSYFSSVQIDEPFRSYGQDNESFCMGTGFPIPLHRRLDYNSNISRPVLESSSKASSNVVGLRMNVGAVRLSSGENRALPDHFGPNNFCSFYQN